jgi:hypothetical protein
LRAQATGNAAASVKTCFHIEIPFQKFKIFYIYLFSVIKYKNKISILK